MPCSSRSSRKAGWPSSVHSDWWTWLDEPARSWSYLAMKVIERPLRKAISLQPFLMIAWHVGGVERVGIADVDLFLAASRPRPWSIRPGCPRRIARCGWRASPLLPWWCRRSRSRHCSCPGSWDRGNWRRAAGRRTVRTGRTPARVAIIGREAHLLRRAIWRLSTARGECGTSSWVWWSSTSQITSAVPSSQGMRRSVARSGFMT